jgi:hypothetical protein
MAAQDKCFSKSIKWWYSLPKEQKNKIMYNLKNNNTQALTFNRFIDIQYQNHLISLKLKLI